MVMHWGGWVWYYFLITKCKASPWFPRNPDEITARVLDEAMIEEKSSEDLTCKLMKPPHEKKKTRNQSF